MEKRTDYKEYEFSRQWLHKKRTTTKASQCGYKYVGECVCAMFDAGDSAKKIGEIFGFKERWARNILQDMGRIEREEFRPLGPKCDRYFLTVEMREKFVSDYDGRRHKIDHARDFKSAHPEVPLSEVQLSKMLKGKKRIKQTRIDKKDYKTLDQNRMWSYREDLITIANELGCEYITEAVAKLHSMGYYGIDIAKKFERTDCWAILVLDYMGLEKKRPGGQSHWGRSL